MKIKGVALLARKSVITRGFGEAAWDELWRDMARSDPYFREPVLATSLVPLAGFLAFHDELVRRFYRDVPKAYAFLGEQSARWAATEGPYKSFVADRDFQGFAEFFPRTWSTYFIDTASRCTTRVSDDRVIEFRAFDLPHWHPYFEYFVVGYFKGALELVCANPVLTRQVQGGRGTSYHYEIWLQALGADRTER
jgi:hypothetical protein